MTDEKKNCKTPPELALMPDIVLSNIFNKLDLFSGLKVKNTCMRLRFVSNSGTIPCDHGRVIIFKEKIILQFDDFHVTYQKLGRDCLVQKSNGPMHKIFNQDYKNVALNNLKSVLQCVNFCINHLEFLVSPECERIYAKLIFTIIKSLENGGRPKKLKIKVLFNHSINLGKINKLIQFMEPGYLNTMLFLFDQTREQDFDKIVHTQQWLQCETLGIHGNTEEFVPLKYLKNFSHFNNIDLHCSPTLAEMLHFSGTITVSPTFQLCQIYTSRPEFDFEHLETALGLTDPYEGPDGHTCYSLAIPDSDDRITYNLSYDTCVIRREKYNKDTGKYERSLAPFFSLRSYVDDKKPDCQIRTLNAFINVDEAQIILENELEGWIHIRYKAVNENTTSVREKQERKTDGINFMKALNSDLEILLKHQKPASEPITLFIQIDNYENKKLVDENNMNRLIETFLTELKQVLTSRAHPIRIDSLAIEMLDRKHVMQVLPFFTQRLWEDSG
ncbi:hypothetical protein CRE_16651 [Caenorhabditis remanei]|uniref:DUF38 domain-containing protein n=1 Tax=Caenorhabditis remanei TaxID=31234 RepID=E3MAY1_CAERE|nr:hypothetical protein CRE_16651 [Caenorhabditis remanei]